MSRPLLVAWLSWCSATAWRFRPATLPRRAVHPDAASVGRHLRPGEQLVVLGDALTARIPGLAEADPRLVACCAVVALPLLLVGGVPGVVVVVGLLGFVRVSGRRRARRRDARFVDELAVAVVMVRVATSSGLAIGPALDAAQRHAPRGCDAGLALVVSRMQRGASLDDAISAWVASHGPPADELAALVRAADRTGASVGAGLERLAGELRRRRKVEAEARARRLPVTMLAPLVICILPAFGLVTVVPMVVVGLTGLSP